MRRYVSTALSNSNSNVNSPVLNTSGRCLGSEIDLWPIVTHLTTVLLLLDFFFFKKA